MKTQERNGRQDEVDNVARKAEESRDSGLYRIDPASLVKQWFEQAAAYHRWALGVADAWEQHAMAKVDVDLAEDHLKRVAAQVSLKVRKSPERFGLEKITEPAIDAVVLISASYVRAQERVYEARCCVAHLKHDADVLEAARAAMDHKKKGLEKGVDLWLADFFAVPKSPDGEKARERMEHEHRTRARRVKR
jgi:hypothetical protein